jgi:hypothetical protein
MFNKTHMPFLAVSHPTTRARLSPLSWSLLASLIFLISLTLSLQAFAEGGEVDKTLVKSEVKSVAQRVNVSKTNTSETSISEKQDSPLAAKDDFNSDREARLEELRYKHLWIAYSFVWLIIFLFIRQTWQRSQAVSNRLDELKSRLIKLEEGEVE